MLSLELWIRVLSASWEYAAENNTTFVSNHLSKLIAQFAATNTQDLDMATFAKPTAPDELPTISHNAAILLLEIEDELEDKWGPTNLHMRCASALVSEWVRTGKMTDSPQVQQLQQRKPTFLTQLLAKSQRSFRDRLNSVEDDLVSARRRGKRKKRRGKKS